MKKNYLKERVKGIIIGMAIMMVFSFVSNDSIAATMRKSIDVLYSDIKIVIDGVKITPKDGKGEVVEPFIYKGTTYLPVRAISEGLGEQVNWDQQTKTVYIGEKPKVTYSSCTPKEFLERHKPYEGSKFTVKGPGTVQIRQEDFNYFNFLINGDGTYLVNGNYTKIKGLFLTGDNGEGANGPLFFNVVGDGKVLFNGGKYLESLGYESVKGTYINKGSKNQPVPFEIDITGVEELYLDISSDTSYSYDRDAIFNVEFIGLDN